MENSWKVFLDNIKEGKEERLEPNSKVLIVDSMNTFLRCFSAINHLNPEGSHIGGLTGYLKSIGYAIRTIKPTKVILVFDGEGSNTNKKYLYPEYKANRNLTQITNWGFDTKEDENDAMVSQIVRLVEYLSILPVHLLAIPKIEADDVIGYLCKKLPNKVTIMSADRDFFQLVSDKIDVYSPTKKKFYTPKLVKEEFEVYPQNFILYKTFLGDKGDNIPKIKGFGEDKLFKILPALKEKKNLSLNESLDLIDCNDKWGSKIIAYKNQLEINYKLIDIVNPNIPESEIEVIDNTINNSNIEFDRNTFIQMYNNDMLGESIPNIEMWLETNFRYLTAYK